MPRNKIGHRNILQKISYGRAPFQAPIPGAFCQSEVPTILLFELLPLEGKAPSQALWLRTLGDREASVCPNLMCEQRVR